MPRSPVTLVIAALLAAACPGRTGAREDGGERGVDTDASAVAVTAVADASAVGAVGDPAVCGFTWASSTALPLPTARSFELAGACSGDALVAVWRAEGVVSTARRALTPEAAWVPLPEPVTTDATALGEPFGADGAVWLTWQSAGGWLRAARVDPGRVRASAPVALVGVTLSDPHVMYAADEAALLAATARSREGSWAMLLRLGLTTAPPLSGYVLGGGTLAAAGGGTHALAAWTTAATGRPCVLHAARVDAVRALALDSPRGFEPVPPDVVSGAGEVELGTGQFEFSPGAAVTAGAVLFDAVVGVERGAARLAWFPPTGEASVQVLPLVPSALAGGADGERAGQVDATFWDDRDVLRSITATATPAGAGAAQGVALPVGTTVQAALGTREVTCGGRRWVLYALRTGDSARLYAEPAACVVR